MSCLGPNYNPNPPKEWSRFQNNCSGDTIPQIDTTILLDSNNIIPNDYKYRLAAYKKGNILQYKKNSASITKSQRYAQIAKGMWVNRTKTWSSQSEIVSNPNTDLLKRVNYTTNIIPNYSLDGTEVIVPILSSATNSSCLLDTVTNFVSLPPIGTGNPTIPTIPDTEYTQATITLPPYINIPKIVPSKAIQTGGSLLCNIVEDPCTGEVLDRTYTKDCYPNTASDVPGPFTELCWNDGLQTYYPKTKLTYGTSGNKWPTNSKLIFSADLFNNPIYNYLSNKDASSPPASILTPPPTILSVTATSNEANVYWMNDPGVDINTIEGYIITLVPIPPPTILSVTATSNEANVYWTNDTGVDINTIDGYIITLTY